MPFEYTTTESERGQPVAVPDGEGWELVTSNTFWENGSLGLVNGYWTTIWVWKRQVVQPGCRGCCYLEQGFIDDWCEEGGHKRLERVDGVAVRKPGCKGPKG